jgi:hypothetical protein
MPPIITFTILKFQLVTDPGLLRFAQIAVSGHPCQLSSAVCSERAGGELACLRLGGAARAPDRTRPCLAGIVIYMLTPLVAKGQIMFMVDHPLAGWLAACLVAATVTCA